MARALVVRLATFPTTPLLPSVVVPSLKMIVPVACPPYCGAIVTVKVTGESSPDGLRLEIRVSVVLA